MKTCKKGLHQYEGKRCKECQATRNSEWFKTNPDKRKSYNAKFVAENPKKIVKFNARSAKRRGPTLEYKLSQRGRRLQKYWPGVTWEQALQNYAKLFEAQQGKCAICEVHQDAYTRSHAVDHDHKTGAVRGLLCLVCNRYVIGGIDTRIKAAKVTINIHKLIENIKLYYKGG